MTDFAELAVVVDSSDLKKGRDEMGRFVKKGKETESSVTKSAAAIGRSWSKMAAGIGIALSAVFSSGAVIRGISDFEKSMSKVAAISGATGRELEDLRKTAQRLGSTTEFSAGQAADALGFLSMAGFEASESMAAIPAVLDLATASGLDLANAADIASNVLSGFGKSADQAANVADVLAEAASASNTSVSQLGQAMSTVAPISAALGISMEETAAAIGVMSDAGIQGERAGTALRGVMSSLAGPTDGAADALAKYGLTVADVNPETRGLTEIMATLAERGLSTADAMTIFGREAASGALVMAGAADSMGNLTAQFQAADGAAAAMAGTMRDNLGGDLNGLKSAAEGLILSLGEAGLSAILRTITQLLTGIVRGATAVVTAFSTMTTAVNNFVLSKSNAAVAIDNNTLAMGDEIAQANALFTLMGQGNTMTQSAALAKLSEAEAHMRNAEALRVETQAIVDMQVAALELQRITAQDALRSIAAPGTDLADIAAHMRDAYEETEQSLARIVRDQASLRAIAAGTTGEFTAAQSEVDRIRDAIGRAVDGMVTFDGEVITANELTERLSLLANGVNFDGATASAQRLAAQLGISLELATRLAAMGAQGISGTRDENGLQYGGRGGDPRKMGGRALDIQTAGAGDFLANWKAPTLSGGGGGGGGASAEQSMSALDRLLNGVTDQTPTEKVEAWHSEVMTALNDANLIERGMLQEHADYKLNIEKLYQQQLAEIQANEHSARLQELGGFFGTMADIAETGGAKMAKIAAAFSGAQTMIAAYEAAMKAAAEAKTIPGRLAAYAAFVAKGVATVNAIKKAGDNPRSVGGGVSSAGGESAAQAPAPMQVSLEGVSDNNWYSGRNINDMLDGLSEAAGDRGMIIMRPA